MESLQSPQTRPGLLRAAAAARLAGIGREAFVNGCRSGSIPVELIEIGPRRLRYVRVPELANWLRGKAADLNLFV
ncbi:MAG: hypothetical protein OJF60_002191 [Burkholderiaceae bacterium]|jgi:hypothetical protein|nr:MAG: hypothetical protein OJF60_002191 [Burkholderiaceae bacterium]